MDQNSCVSGSMIILSLGYYLHDKILKYLIPSMIGVSSLGSWIPLGGSRVLPMNGSRVSCPTFRICLLTMDETLYKPKTYELKKNTFLDPW